VKLTKEQFIENTVNAVKSVGLDISVKQAEMLYTYKELLVDWNEKINLTAVTEDDEVIVKHIVDSLYVAKYIKEGDKVIDVGTGAGLPGMILAIYFDGKAEFTLFDALNKRIIFLDEVINVLGLKSVKAVHGRAEETAKEAGFREAYDVVVSRAVARLNVLMELTSPFAKVGGKCIYMKADKTEEEMKETNKAVVELVLKLKDTYEYQLEYNNEYFRRTIIEYTKTNNVKDKYPRQFAKIKKQPL
jgi:16S rRNA (guanine527-N7)-methyltransferase